MTWFRVDDRLHDHRKARKAGTQAMGVWIMAGSWSAANLTDGFVPEDILTRWGTKSDADKLVTAGLWYADEEDGEQGWRFHDWLTYQPDARTVRLRQEAESKAGSLGNHRRWHSKRDVFDPECEHCVESGTPSGTRSGSRSGRRIAPESPVPSRPVPTHIPTATDVASDDGSPTQRLIAEWIDNSTQRPPSRVIGQVSKELKQLLTEDQVPEQQVRDGLIAWNRKKLHPSALASVVHEQRPHRIASNGMPLVSLADDVR